jgi:hypothetical protein
MLHPSKSSSGLLLVLLATTACTCAPVGGGVFDKLTSFFGPPSRAAPSNADQSHVHASDQHASLQPVAFDGMYGSSPGKYSAGRGPYDQPTMEQLRDMSHEEVTHIDGDRYRELLHQDPRVVADHLHEKALRLHSVKYGRARRGSGGYEIPPRPSETDRLHDPYWQAIASSERLLPQIETAREVLEKNGELNAKESLLFAGLAPAETSRLQKFPHRPIDKVISSQHLATQHPHERETVTWAEKPDPALTSKNIYMPSAQHRLRSNAARKIHTEKPGTSLHELAYPLLGETKSARE